MSSESPEPLVRDAFAVRERLGDPRLPLIIGCLPLPVDPRQWRYPAPFAPRALPRFITTKKQTLRRSSIPTTRQWLMSVSFAVGRQKPVANYYHSPGWGAPLTTDAGYRGKLSNINLGGDLGLSHVAIDKSPKIQAEIERAILALPQTR